jgi:tetratricopeptide (TPR) repeat protein
MRLVIAFGYYFQKSIWPNVINPYIVNLPMGAAFFAMSLVYIILITAVCWQTLRSARAIFFHISLYIICLGPGILVSWGSSSGVPLAERYLYLPLYGICFIFGWCLTQNDSSTKASEHKQKKMVVKIVFATGIILTSAWLSYQRAEIWQNDWSFWKQAVKMNPRDVAPWSNLGRVALQYGDQPRAMAYFDKALSLKTNQIPNFVLAELYANKAICLKHLNREDEGQDSPRCRHGACDLRCASTARRSASVSTPIVGSEVSAT